MTDEAAVSLYSMVDQFIEGSSANSPLRRDWNKRLFGSTWSALDQLDSPRIFL
jgi:hypothetical protein